MPKYDYRCSACGSEYEKRESFSAPAVQPCPSCNGEARRLLRPPAIVFKGSGWYKTDSRGSAPSDSGSSSASSTSSESSSSEPATTTKTDAPVPATTD